jgi:hypothetical protein
MMPAFFRAVPSIAKSAQRFVASAMMWRSRSVLADEQVDEMFASRARDIFAGRSGLDAVQTASGSRMRLPRTSSLNFTLSILPVIRRAGLFGVSAIIGPHQEDVADEEIEQIFASRARDIFAGRTKEWDTETRDSRIAETTAGANVRWPRLAYLICMTIIMMLSTAVFFGTREIISGIGSMSVCAPLFSAGGYGMVFLFAWHLLFGRVAVMGPPQRRMQFILPALAVVGLQALFSAWPVAAIIAGDRPITIHLTRHLAEARTAMLLADQVAAQQSQIIRAIDTAAEASRVALAKLEISDDGRAHSVSRSAMEARDRAAAAERARNLSSIATQVHTVATQSDLDYIDGKAILAQMERTLGDSLVGDKAILYYARHGVQPSTDLQNQYAALASRLASITQAFNGRSIALLTNLEGAAEFNDDVALRAQAIRAVEVPGFKPLSIGMAVGTYASEFLLRWATAIAIVLGLSLLPLFFLMGTIPGQSGVVRRE